jgi:hypothetical protein
MWASGPPCRTSHTPGARSHAEESACSARGEARDAHTTSTAALYTHDSLKEMPSVHILLLLAVIVPHTAPTLNQSFPNSPFLSPSQPYLVLL